VNSLDQKPELQPVHRIFLGELFVFVFFFAAGMSVLVGPLGVPVETAGMTIGASVVLSGMCFFWLVFTTPVRKDEPRYAYMALSLLPAVFICGSLLGFRQLAHPTPVPNINLEIETISRKRSVNSSSARQSFADELAALDKTLISMGFAKTFSSDLVTQYHRVGKVEPNVAVQAILVNLGNGDDLLAMQISNYNLNYTECYYKTGRESWVRVLQQEIKTLWRQNLEEQKAAAKKQQN